METEEPLWWSLCLRIRVCPAGYTNARCTLKKNKNPGQAIEGRKSRNRRDVCPALIVAAPTVLLFNREKECWCGTGKGHLWVCKHSQKTRKKEGRALIKLKGSIMPQAFWEQPVYGFSERQVLAPNEEDPSVPAQEITVISKYTAINLFFKRN